MTVRCIKLANVKGESQTTSSWLTVGKTYQVLSIELDMDGNWFFRLNGDSSNGVALFEKDQFEIISAALPSSWVPAWNHKGGFELAPKAWTTPGFWERYYDREDEAVRLFDSEMKKLGAVDADLA
jgi:hypothetical protein